MILEGWKIVNLFYIKKIIKQIVYIHNNKRIDCMRVQTIEYTYVIVMVINLRGEFRQSPQKRSLLGHFLPHTSWHRTFLIFKNSFFPPK
jgi:hypothetical protein